jgi:hypothetical protein
MLRPEGGGCAAPSDCVAVLKEPCCNHTTPAEFKNPNPDPTRRGARCFDLHNSGMAAEDHPPMARG